MTKIQISPIRIVKDAMTVWNEPGPEVDLTMDLAKLTFKEGSLDAIYSFHVLDHLFLPEALRAIQNWLKCLKPGAELFTVVDDFEYICRSFVGGELPINDINEKFSHPTVFDRYNLSDLYRAAGVVPDDIRIWFADVPELFPKKHYELILNTTKK